MAWKREDYRTLIQGVASIGMLFAGGWKRVVLGIAGMGAGMFMQPKVKDIQPESETYSWEHKPNLTAFQGLPMPVLYGKTRIKPVVKNRFIEVIGEKQYLNILYSFTGHKIDEVSSELWYRGEWTRGERYEVGDEVSVPGEPGKTYRCIDEHDAGPAGYHYANTALWEDGRGTAAISDIYVNGVLIDNLVTGNSDNFSYETRPGLAEQVEIEGFDTTYVNYPYDIPLYRDFPEINRGQINFREWPGNVIKWDQNILYNDGIPYVIKGGELSPAPAEWYYVYWSPTVENTEYNPRTSELPDIDYIAKVRLTADGDLEIEWNDGPRSEDDFYSPALHISTIHNIQMQVDFPNGLYGMNVEGEVISSHCVIFAQYRIVDAASWTNFEFKANDPFDAVNDYGSDLDGAIITAQKARAFAITFEAKTDGSYLDPEEIYEVRIMASSPSSVVLKNIAGIIYSEPDIDGAVRGFTYPGESLLGIRALATGQLSGDIETTAVCERSKVWVKVSGTWQEFSATNHAWAIYDILTQGHPDHPSYDPENFTGTAHRALTAADAMPRYGCAINPDNVDYFSFQRWANYIDNVLGLADDGTTGNWKLNIVFDQFTSPWDAILHICLEGRGIVHPVGSTIYAVVDRPYLSTLWDDTDYYSPITQLFTSGDIHWDTYRESWVDQNKKPSLIEVTYWDEDRDYERMVFAVRTDNWESETGEPTHLNLYGVTNYNQAYGIAKYILNCNERLNKAVEFSVGTDALQSQVGDVVYLPRYLSGNQGSGKIISANYNYILNSSFETLTGATADNWTGWGPFIGGATREFTTGKKYHATRSFHVLSSTQNYGVYQTVTLLPETEYTLSAWSYNVSYTNTRIMARTRDLDGDSIYYSAHCNGAVNTWMQKSVTFTTPEAADGYTTVNVDIFLGGNGECYYDQIRLDEGDIAPTTYLDGSVVELDTPITPDDSTLYVRKSAEDDFTSIVVQTGPESITTITSSLNWCLGVSQYDSWAYGTLDTYRIPTIDRDGDLRRRISAIEYDEDVYLLDMDLEYPISIQHVGKRADDGVVPPPEPEDPEGFNTASLLTAQEITIQSRSTGEYESAIGLSWKGTDGMSWGEWSIYFRDVDVSDNRWRGQWELDQEYDLFDRVYHNDYTWISLTDNNTEEPSE